MSFGVATISDTTRPAPRRATSRLNGASVTPDIGASTTRFANAIGPMDGPLVWSGFVITSGLHTN